MRCFKLPAMLMRLASASVAWVAMLSSHSLSVSSGSTFIHISPPQSAIAAANRSDAVQPQWSASQGVRLGEITPAMFAPVFITPDRVPAWVLERSVVTLQ